MDQITQIRQQKHKEYLRQIWLPEFFEKYKSFFDLEVKAQRTLVRAIKKHYLPDVSNSEFLEYIPGIYRMRIKLTPDNLIKPQEKYNLDSLSAKNNDSDSSEDYATTKVRNDNADIDQIMEESLKDYNDHFENSIHDVLQESIKDNFDMDYEEYLLNQAVMESLNNSNINLNTDADTNTIINNDIPEYYIVIDIREFHENPLQPLIINDVPYYLSNKQITQLKKLWNKVNPDTSAGMKFQQDLAYQKGLNYDSRL